MARSSSKEVDVMGIEADVSSETASYPALVYEFLNIMTCATARLNLNWLVEMQEPAPGRLDEHFLAGHKMFTSREPSVSL